MLPINSASGPYMLYRSRMKVFQKAELQAVHELEQERCA